MTDAQIMVSAAAIMQAYGDELAVLRKDASHPKQIAFLQSQIDMMPNVMFMLGTAMGRMSLKASLSLEELARFDQEQNRE